MPRKQAPIYGTVKIIRAALPCTNQGSKDDDLTIITNTLSEVTMSNNTIAQAMREEMATLNKEVAAMRAVFVANTQGTTFSGVTTSTGPTNFIPPPPVPPAATCPTPPFHHYHHTKLPFLIKWRTRPPPTPTTLPLLSHIGRGHIDKPISAYTSCCVQTSYVKHSF